MSIISEQLGLTKNRTFRILCTLTRHDYLRQDPATRRYRLGPDSSSSASAPARASNWSRSPRRL
jgi:DNA-binding IclR family transcriptional regulator